MSMINLTNHSTEQQLSDLLSRCGFVSEPAAAAAAWPDLLRYSRLPRPAAPARHLTGEPYHNLFVVVQGGALQIYAWVMLVCELRGDVSAEQVSECIQLSAIPDRAPADPARCICLERPLPFNHYEKVKFIGRDETHGRFGEVTLQRCRHCQRTWLHYFVEYEAYRESGRYFMGLITSAAAEALAPEDAVDYLAGLDWHLYGGSYFGRAGRSTDQHIDVDG